MGTLLAQLLDYNGLGKARTGLTVLPMFFGLLLWSLPPALFRLPRQQQQQQQQQQQGDGEAQRRWDWRLLFLTLLNVGGEIGGQVSITIAGSGLYTVLYSSVIVFVAALRRVVIGKRVSWFMLGGIAVIVAGLATTMADQGVLDRLGEKGGDLWIGIVGGLGSALGYAGYYVMAEGVLVGKGDRPPAATPATVGVAEGYLGTLIVAPYVLFFTGANWRSLVTTNVVDANADPLTVMAVECVLIVVNGLHILAFLILVRHTDAIAAGVNKAVQTVSTFVMSSAFYCARDETQCLSGAKGASLAVVTAGVLLYTAASYRYAKAQAAAAVAAAAKNYDGIADTTSSVNDGHLHDDTHYVAMDDPEVGDSSPSGDLSRRA